MHHSPGELRMRADDTATSDALPFVLYRRSMRFLAGASMLAIVVIMIVQVFARYVLNSSLIWAEELCRYILIWQTFLFIGLAYQRGELIAVEIFTDLLSPFWRFVLRAIVTIPVLVLLGLLIVYGYNYASRFTHQTLPALDFLWSSISGRELGLSVRWVYISVAVGSLLLALHIVASLIVDARALRAAASSPDPRSAE